MPDKGAMIELQVNADRITQLTPLHQPTPLGEVLIVAPVEGEFAELAQALQQRLYDLIGCEPMLLNEADCWHPDELGASTIALGHAANNMLLRSLHYLQFLRNGDYPTTGACLRSIHDPLGDGRNVLCALGYTVEACRNSIDRLVESIHHAGDGWLVPGALHLREPAPETADPAEWLPCLDKLDDSATGQPLLLHPLRLAADSGEERWARAFIQALVPYATGRVPLTFAKMCHVDFWTDTYVTAWDAIEELPCFSDEERLMATNFLISCAQYCHDSITYQKWRILDEEHQIFNHHTFPAMGLFFSCLYLQRHGYELPETEGWLRKSLKVFARAATAGRSFDEGGSGYNWLVGNHLLRVSLAAGDASYLRSEKMCGYADLAAVIMNNAREVVPYGDCGSYHVTGTGASNILLRAAEAHGDPGYKWLAQEHAPKDAEADVFTRELGAEPPARHLGLFVLPMDPVIWRWGHLPRFPNYPPPPLPPTVPPAKGFDKLSLRAGWEPTDDYLLVQGMGFGQHAHPDANSILQYQARGRLFLVESDYIRRMPQQHNMVMVIRDGQHADIPVTARLDKAFAFGRGAFVQTTLPEYNGCDWQRTIVWLRNDCAIVIDTLTALQEGEYELRCYWRTLAETKLTEHGLHTVHDGEHFHVIEATESQRRLDTESKQEALDYPPYHYGAGVPQILRETQRVRLQPGEQTCFVNLLLPNGPAEQPRRKLRLHEDGRVVLTGDGPAVVIGSDGFEVEHSGSHVFAEGERLTALSRGAAYPHAASGREDTPAHAVSVAWEQVLSAPATCLAPAEDDAILFGCADGLIGHVSAEGVMSELARAEDKIGAVLAGRLWGEDELTYLAASYDCTVRMLRPDGSERMKIALPRSSHMPAWGNALTLANLDGDGRLWPVVGTAAWRVHPITPEGKLRWIFDTAAHTVMCLAAGDLNHDGRDEIAVGTIYYCVPAVTADGERLWEDEDYNDYWNAGPRFPFIQIADVDGDGDLEVTTVGSDTLIHCIDRFGVKKWTYSIGDGPRGLMVTPRGIAAASATGDVHLVDGQGRQVWRYVTEVPCTALCAGEMTLCVAHEDGRLQWISLDGETTGEHVLAAPAARLLHVPGAVVAATTDGRIIALR